MAVPTLPQTWTLQPGRGLLKGLVKDTVTDANKENGITAGELQEASERAWHFLLSRLAGLYDISGWGSAPPIILEDIWEKLAAAIILRSITRKYNIADDDADTAADIVKTLKEEADDDIGRLIDPEYERDRTSLIDPHTGALVKPRSGVGIPYMVNPRGMVAFPKNASDTSFGRFTHNGVEQLVEETFG